MSEAERLRQEAKKLKQEYKKYLIKSKGDANKNQYKHDASIWIITGYV